MLVQYDVVITIINIIDGSTSRFTKTLQADIVAASDALLYNNNHVIANEVYLQDLFADEINAYITAMNIQMSSIQIDEFEIVSSQPNADVFFEFTSQANEMQMRPTIKCYVHPKNEALVAPELRGAAYNSTTIIWSWTDDGNAHHLVEEAIDISNEQDRTKIVAQLPVGVCTFSEAGLEPNTHYTRRLIAYTSEQTSSASAPCTVQTEVVPVSQSIEEYSVAKNYDFTSDDAERQIILDRMKAFHSGVGDFTDLKVYKQMDADFYQQFKAYFEISGRRIERERRYDQVGFHYKLCMEAIETVEEQEGEVTFDVFAYPREWVTIEDYIWASRPVKVKTRFTASVFLRKEVPAQEEEEIQLFEPNYEVTDIEETLEATVPFAKPTAVIISIDFSSSMLDHVNGSSNARIDAVETAVCALIDEIDRQVKETQDLIGEDILRENVQPFTPENIVQYIIVKWAAKGKCVYDGYSAEDAKKAVETHADMLRDKEYDGLSYYTNFYEGLNTGWGYVKDANGTYVSAGGATTGENARAIVGQIFFTDGFANVFSDQYGDSGDHYTDVDKILTTYTPYDGYYGPDGNREYSTNILTSIRVDTNRYPYAAGHHTHIVMANGINSYDADYSNDENLKKKILYQNAAIVYRCQGQTQHYQDFKFTSSWYDGSSAQRPVITKDTIDVLYDINIHKCYYPDYNGSPNDSGMLHPDEDVETLTQAFIKGLEMFKKKTVIEGYNHIEEKKFNGWKVQSEQVATVNTYSLDDVKVVTVTSEEFEFTFDETLTPIRYNRAGKRAIVPESSFVPPTKLSNTNLYDMIMDMVQQTPEWQNGYCHTIGTVEASGEQDSFLIKGLHIQNTYEFADEDIPPSASWGIDQYEDGMEGSVNSFTDINKANTATYGDDCYLVSRNNYLMIQGYTDAIIYDGTRFVTAELNAYDRPLEILVSASANYANELWNRKNHSILYTGVGPFNHVIDVYQKDADIILDGYPDLKKSGDWLEIGQLTQDLTARIERWYKSPILNYRFNLEDPDAKTPLYEILPDCDVNNNYLHIVFLHVYYANNVWITDVGNYVPSFGSDPIATPSSSYIPLVEDVYQWTKREWKDGRDNGWYIDNYLWFMSKKMTKEQDYYAELPGPGMETFYGLVNNRYSSAGQDGKKDLRVDTPQFNIPTTVHQDTIKIYIVITEYHPENAIVSYKWENPWNLKDSITQVNGDYVTFSADSITFKDVEYFDVIATMNMENQEIYGHKTTECIYALEKPNTVRQYENYYLNVFTSNADVMAMRYPHEVVFDDNNRAEIGVAFKGVVNATSKWAPRIHNGYYYLNQHEYFAYSEFNVEAKFETYDETIFKDINGYLTIEVVLRHAATPREDYSITKDTRAELLQNEEDFQWVDGKGMTLKPVIDGLYYRDYVPCVYTSPVIMFPNRLTTAGALNVDYFFEDGSTELPLEVRSYDLDAGQWSQWTPFVNGTTPSVPLSHAYQIRCTLQASTQETPLFLEDYMCCYLDWKDDMSEPNTTNIVTITDHMTTGPFEGEGVYVSKVLDFGCLSDLQLDMFQSYYKAKIQLYIAHADNEDDLLLENAQWTNISNAGGLAFTSRFFRYKIIIPEGEKLYWLHKRVNTFQTHELLPYVTGIRMQGSYEPNSVVENFINTESFTIQKDGQSHEVFDKVSDIIMADVTERGYTAHEIQNVFITCTTSNIDISYNAGLDEFYPYAYLDTPIVAQTDADTEILIKNTPYILVEKTTDEKFDVVVIKGTPQQYCPITVEDPDGNTYIQLHYATSFVQQKDYVTMEATKYIELPTNRYDPAKLLIYLDGQLLTVNDYTVTNHLVIFNDFIDAGHTITVEYCVLHSFMADVNRETDTTTIYLHTGEGIPIPKKVKVFFETGKKNNKFIANELSLNPIYRTDYKGFIYLTDDPNEPYKINIYCNPPRLKHGGFDKVDVVIEVLDIQDNPVINKEVTIDCNYGGLPNSADGKYITDNNGVVHIVYESSHLSSTDQLCVRTLDSDGNVISASIAIVNE